jgi:NAD-dependent dihydropyrimidine dehydrogenase PreA subunit
VHAVAEGSNNVSGSAAGFDGFPDRLSRRHETSTQAGYAPERERALGRVGAAMTYIVTETCVDLKDKSCIEVCPVDCIHEAEEDRMVYIDPDECIDCGACVDPCPVDAIYAEEDVPDAQIAFVDINKVYFKDKSLARSQVAGLKPQVA